MSENIRLTAGGDTFDAYVARPAAEPVGALVVIHEIWGLAAHIEEVAERFAGTGYLVIAPDILSHAGVAPALGAELFQLMLQGGENERVGAQPRMREAMSGMRAPEYAHWAVSALRASVDWLESQTEAGVLIGVVGFCFGGTYAFGLASADDRIVAAVPFYGGAPSTEQMTSIHAPILAVYGQEDPALIDALPAVRAQMAAAGVDFEAVVYPGASHAFFNDSGPRYDAAAAADAWDRVRAFLGQHVAGVTDGAGSFPDP